MKKKLYFIVVTLAIGTAAGALLRAIFDIHPRDPIFPLLMLALGFLLAKAGWEFLPVIWDELYAQFWDGSFHDSKGRPFGLKQLFFLLAAIVFFFYNIRDWFLKFGNWFMNLDSPEGIIRRYDSLSRFGAFLVAAVSIALTLFLWKRLRENAFFQEMAAVLTLLLAVGAVGVFVLSFEALGKTALASFPDLAVMRWAAPAFILSYYGRNSRLRAVARWGKIIALVCICLSAAALGLKVCAAVREALKYRVK